MELNPRLDKLSFDMGVLYAFAEMVARGNHQSWTRYFHLPKKSQPNTE